MVSGDASAELQGANNPGDQIIYKVMLGIRMVSGKYGELAGGVPVGMSSYFPLPRSTGRRPFILGILNKVMIMTDQMSTFYRNRRNSWHFLRGGEQARIHI